MNTVMEATVPKIAYDSVRDSLESYKRRSEMQFDAYEEALAAKDQENAELRKQLEQERAEKEAFAKKDQEKSSRIDNLFMELNWIRKIHYNPSLRPVERDVLITARDHARTGNEARIFVGTKAKQTGMARNTYGSTLQKLGDFGVIEYRNTEPTKDAKGKISEEVYITFPEQLLKNPDEIVIDRGPENRGGNAKEKAAKKACPNCNSIQLEEGKVCYCKNCNHHWEEGKRKDVNDLSPQDEMRESANAAPQEPTNLSQYRAAIKDQKNAEKEFDTAFKSANTSKPQQESFMEDAPLGEPAWITENYGLPASELAKQMDTLFPEEKPKAKMEPGANIDPRLPDRDCLRCGARKWEWDDVFDMPKCGGCG